MRLLITAGPTREPIDPVRFLSNRSTGAMGFAIARAACARGHEVILVLGPVGARQPPVGVEVYGVETARDMLDAVLHFLPQVDAVVCTAAVSDYRPAHPSEKKLKRGGGLHAIEIIENPDIAAEIGRRRAAKPLVVFALETDDGVAHAAKKIEMKNADFCVLNGPDAIGADEADFTFVFRDGTTRPLGRLSKDDLADAVLEEIG